MPHVLRLRQVLQARVGPRRNHRALFPRSAPEAILFSLVTSQGSQRGTLHSYLCLGALVLIIRLPRLSLICTLGWVEGGNSVIWGGQSNLLEIASLTRSLREAQSLAELHLWGWVRKAGSVLLLHS